MTTDDKLQYFLTICMEDAQGKSDHLLKQYSSSLEKNLEEHKREASRLAHLQVQGEKEKLQHKMNKELALGQMNIKRNFSRRHDELKEKLFVEINELLDCYRETPKYTEWLKKQVKEAEIFAGKEKLTVYLDPKDADKLSQFTGDAAPDTAVEVSQYSFGGGIRAVIPSRNILIDQSFDSKLAEAKETFRFELGGSAHD